MVEKNTTLVLDNEVIDSLKRKGYNISHEVREFLKELNKSDKGGEIQK